jgi:GNAT superfamily N-acetyltransferase
VSRLEKLDAHETAGFDCGDAALNAWLNRHALVNERSGMSSTYVLVDDGRVAGFVSLAAGSIVRDLAPDWIAAGVPRHPIPIMVIARLGVDLRDQGRGVGRHLLAFALLKSVEVSEIIGIRAVSIHAKDASARAFYLHLAEFEPSPVDPLSLFVLMKDLRRAAAE